MSQPPTTLYSFSFAHHGRYSSFHRLLHYAQGHHTIDITLPLPEFLSAKTVNRIEWRWRQIAEWRLRMIFRKQQRQCVHYLYPENSLFRGWRWKKQHRLILSCHQPAAVVQTMKKAGNSPFIRGLENADKIVLLTDSFRDGYAAFCDSSKLHVIHHGVDVHFFSKRSSPPSNPLLVTIGNWLRDYELWANVILELAGQMTNLHFAVVALPSVVGESFEKVKRQLGARVRLLHGLSDEELRDLYRQASALFLPLKDAGANNALLEAMSCGLPVVVSDLPATREYAGDAAIFTERNADECVAKLLNLLKDKSIQDELSIRGRRRAVEKFSWEIIAAQYSRLYEDLLTK